MKKHPRSSLEQQGVLSQLVLKVSFGYDVFPCVLLHSHVRSFSVQPLRDVHLLSANPWSVEARDENLGGAVLCLSFVKYCSLV